LSKISLTAAGQTSPANTSNSTLSNELRNELIDAINQVFTLFRINFHNQYYKAYSDDSALLSQAKKLWFESLKQYDANTVLEATKRIIEETEYLPTLHQMLNRCAQTDSNAPSHHQAYVEACRAASPKAEQDWSHPAVYEAGKRSDWFFLSTTPEQFAFPVFKNNYEQLLRQINDGVFFEQPVLTNQDNKDNIKTVSKKQGLKNLKDLKESLDL